MKKIILISIIFLSFNLQAQIKFTVKEQVNTHLATIIAKYSDRNAVGNIKIPSDPNKKYCIVSIIDIDFKQNLQVWVNKLGETTIVIKDVVGDDNFKYTTFINLDNSSLNVKKDIKSDYYYVADLNSLNKIDKLVDMTGSMSRFLNF